jgi:hypothetical protein
MFLTSSCKAADSEQPLDLIPSVYSSFGELENAAKSGDLDYLSFYYTSKVANDIAKLDSILASSRYLSVYYSLAPLEEIIFESPDDEEVARLSVTLKLEWERDPKGESLLKNTVKQQNLTAHSGELYYADLSNPTFPDGTLAKSFYWVQDGYMFNLDIPIAIYDMYVSSDRFAEITQLDRIDIQ